jgi:hypothetical protein
MSACFLELLSKFGIREHIFQLQINNPNFILQAIIGSSLEKRGFIFEIVALFSW